MQVGIQLSDLEFVLTPFMEKWFEDNLSRHAGAPRIVPRDQITFNVLLNIACKEGRLDILELFNTHGLLKSDSFVSVSPALTHPNFRLIVKWFLDHGYKLENEHAVIIVRKEKLETLQWLKDLGCPCDDPVLFAAALRTGNTKIIKWLQDVKCRWDGSVLTQALMTRKHKDFTDWCLANQHLKRESGVPFWSG